MKFKEILLEILEEQSASELTELKRELNKRNISYDTQGQKVVIEGTNFSVDVKSGVIKIKSWKIKELGKVIDTKDIGNVIEYTTSNGYIVKYRKNMIVIAKS